MAVPSSNVIVITARCLLDSQQRSLRECMGLVVEGRGGRNKRKFEGSELMQAFEAELFWPGNLMQQEGTRHMSG